MVAGGSSFESFASGGASPAFGGAAFPQTNQPSFGGQVFSLLILYQSFEILSEFLLKMLWLIEVYWQDSSTQGFQD